MNENPLNFLKRLDFPLGRLFLISIRLELQRQPWTQAITFIGLTLTAFFIGLLLLTLNNLDQNSLATQQRSIVYQLYWKPTAELAKIQTQLIELTKLPHFRELATFTPEQALEQLICSNNVTPECSPILKDFALTPFGAKSLLPFTALISFDLTANKDTLDYNLGKRLAALPGIESVHANSTTNSLASAWRSCFAACLWPMFGLLLLIYALLVSNIIQISLLHSRAEIDILQKIGASFWYIRMPIASLAVLHSLAASSVALLLLKLFQRKMQNLLQFLPFVVHWTCLPFTFRLILLFMIVMITTAMIASLLTMRE